MLEKTATAPQQFADREENHVKLMKAIARLDAVHYRMDSLIGRIAGDDATKKAAENIIPLLYVLESVPSEVNNQIDALLDKLEYLEGRLYGEIAEGRR